METTNTDIKTDMETKIREYYEKNCKHKGLILIKSEKRMDKDFHMNLYDYTFRYEEKEMNVTFTDDDDDDDIKMRIKIVLRENNIYL